MRTINTIHSRKPVLSREEQIRFDNTKQYYLGQGYPVEIATQYAWDEYSIQKSIERGTYKPRGRF